MTEKEIRLEIARIIIGIKKPFSIVDLVNACAHLPLQDTDVIFEVLEQLCDAGLVSYSEIRDNCWAFTSVQ